MQELEALEVGVMFWAGNDPRQTLNEIIALGVRCGQLGVPAGMALDGGAAKAWAQALSEANFTLVTVFAAYEGESYGDIAKVQSTVGFVPAATRKEREERTYRVIDFAAELGVYSFSCHIGFVPEDRSHPEYAAVRDMVRRVADYAAGQGATFALETGQEPAKVLLDFLVDVDRTNVGINFDPANMILYGTGNPIEALSALSTKVLSVHCKDGDWPSRDQPLALGQEKPLGKGSVGIAEYVKTLKRLGFEGPLNIEREVEDPAVRMRDLSAGVALLQSLRS